MWIKIFGTLGCLFAIACVFLTIYFAKTETDGCPKLVSMWCTVISRQILPEGYYQYGVYGIYSDNITRSCQFGICTTNSSDKHTPNCSIYNNRTCTAHELHTSASLICDSGCYNKEKDNLFALFFFLSILAAPVGVAIFVFCVTNVIINRWCKNANTNEDTIEERRPLTINYL